MLCINPKNQLKKPPLEHKYAQIQAHTIHFVSVQSETAPFVRFCSYQTWFRM